MKQAQHHPWLNHEKFADYLVDFDKFLLDREIKLNPRQKVDLDLNLLN